MGNFSLRIYCVVNSEIVLKILRFHLIYRRLYKEKFQKQEQVSPARGAGSAQPRLRGYTTEPLRPAATSRCALRVCRPQAANILYTFQGRQHLGSFFTEPLEPIRNGFYFFGRRSVDSRAQMCYDDAIQSGMCL